MLRFNFPASLVPPDQYRAVMPDGHVVRYADRNVWFGEIKNHYRRNSYVLPEGWRSHYEDQFCKLLPPGYCVNDSGVSANTQDIRIGIEDLKHGMQVLWNITRTENPLVDRSTASARGAICAACPANIHVPGCKPCIQLANTIMDIKGRGTTPADPFLRTCAVCKCSNQAQVWVKSEILGHGVTPEQLRHMSELNPSCWKSRELLDNQPS